MRPYFKVILCFQRKGTAELRIRLPWLSGINSPTSLSVCQFMLKCCIVWILRTEEWIHFLAATNPLIDIEKRYEEVYFELEIWFTALFSSLAAIPVKVLLSFSYFAYFWHQFEILMSANLPTHTKPHSTLWYGKQGGRRCYCLKSWWWELDTHNYKEMEMLYCGIL